MRALAGGQGVHVLDVHRDQVPVRHQVDQHAARRHHHRHAHPAGACALGVTCGAGCPRARSLLRLARCVPRQPTLAEAAYPPLCCGIHDSRVSLHAASCAAWLTLRAERRRAARRTAWWACCSRSCPCWRAAAGRTATAWTSCARWSGAARPPPRLARGSAEQRSPLPAQMALRARPFMFRASAGHSRRQVASSMALSLPVPVSWAVKQADAGFQGTTSSAATVQQQRGVPSRAHPPWERTGKHIQHKLHAARWSFTAARSVTFTLAIGLAAAMAFARTALPAGLRALSRHASPELYQLTLIAFCLLCGWLSGYMARPPGPARNTLSILLHSRARAGQCAARAYRAGPACM